MKKIILMGFIMILLIFIIGCTPKISPEETLPQEYKDITEEAPLEPTVKVVDVNTGREEKTPIISEKPEAKEIPISYQIKNIPYYGELNFCYGASAMMILMYNGFSKEQAQEYRTKVKAGPGGPPDMFSGFKKINVMDRVKIAYSKNYNKEYADFYRNFFDSPEEQIITFIDGEEALEYFKKLISADTPVIIVVHKGNHYVVAVGYDEKYIYTNDPGWDGGWKYSIDGEKSLKQRRIPLESFLDEWNVKNFEGGGIGFPGDYGMIWLEIKNEKL